MFITATLMSFALAGAQPITTIERAEPPRSRDQRAEDERNRVTEGERSGDGATPDRLICDWRRIPGSNRRERVCQTVADRRATRDVARETLQQMQGSVTNPVG